MCTAGARAPICSGIVLSPRAALQWRHARSHPPPIATGRPLHERTLARGIAGFAGIAMLPCWKPSSGERLIVGINEVDKMLERAREVTRNGKYTYIEYARFADDLVRWKWPWSSPASLVPSRTWKYGARAATAFPS